MRKMDSQSFGINKSFEDVSAQSLEFRDVNLKVLTKHFSQKCLTHKTTLIHTSIH